MLRKLFSIIPLIALLSACQEGMSNEIQSDSVELQRQANEEAAFAMAEGNEDRLKSAKKLIEKSLEADPNNHYALINRSQISIYQKNYELALSDVERAYTIAPSNDSLPLFRCMLIEEIEGDDNGRECYSAVEESYAERHESDEEIPANWVSAAILADSQASPELAEAYLAQEKAKGEMEAEFAEMTIQSLQNGSYVDQVLMR